MKKNDNKFLRRTLCILAIATILISLILTIVFSILGNFEWASILCALLSAIGTITLAFVTIIQNKMAEKTNKRLAQVNNDQFEASIINNNYPLVKFCDLQRIENNGDGSKKFVFRFFDIRNIPLKEAYTKNVGFVPLADKYKEEENSKWITMRRKQKKDALQFTYLHEDTADGLYMIVVPMKEPMFDDHRYCRAELEMDIVSATGVVTRCKGYALLDSESNHKGMLGREYPSVYHQFFEIKEIMSEQKYLDSKKQKN